MNSYLNYLIEANLCLCFCLAFYVLVLARETDFRFKRFMLLMGIAISIIFPLLHLESDGTNSLIPAIHDVIPAYWLPEVVIGTSPSEETVMMPTLWTYAGWLYYAGVAFFMMVFLIRLVQVISIIRKSAGTRDGKFIIAESDAALPAFSFFQYIFLGRKQMISEQEKQQIIAHEKVHGERYHSFDILLLNIIHVFFWFNPLISIYKKIFVQLHEFEADARTVENRDVNDYCSLLAKVALLSADFKLANHFNNSLTVKRINMMRTIKSKIQPWKIAAYGILLSVIFVGVACQDQINGDLNEIAKNSSGAIIVPVPVQQQYDQLKKEHPGSEFVMLQLNEDGTKTLKELEAKYGLPKSMHVFKADDEATTGGDPAFKGQSFAIMEYTEEARRFSEVTTDGEVFTVVEKMPEYKGGFEALGSFLGENIQYPTSAREAGVAGTVFTQFIVNPDGSISNVTVAKGVNPEIDNEAMRVVKAMPAWTPGTQDGKAVKVKFVLPIKFAI